MVMEAPSAQCVGREFVRQYYTLLHEAPDFLHRFYSHNSCFVHGGVEKPGEEQPPVQGQANIHKKILSLNFRDCHAKIRQVDSQATVGSAVVVQVSGELSNAGQPMRRFMQTFVLAPQSLKKYYVHNDIFRYQDEVYHDSDNDTETQEDVVDSDTENVDQGEDVQDSTVTSAITSFGSGYETTTATHAPASQVTLSNGNSMVTVEDQEIAEAEAVAEDLNELDLNNENVVEYEEALEDQEDVQETAEIEDDKAYEPEPQPQEPNKPLSWAMMAGKNTNSGSAVVQQTYQKPAPSQAPVAPKSAPAMQQTKPISEKRPVTGNEIQGAPDQAKPPREQRPPRRNDTGRPERDSSRSGAGGEPGEDFRRSRYPDTQQLFVGNLPHTVSDKELKEQFDEYGEVLEVRINRKSNRDVPNFGFVVFDSPTAVNKVLKAKPISTRDGHRLNVEEKKNRSEQTARPGSGARGAPRGGLGGRGGLFGRSDRGRGGMRGGAGGGGGSDMRGPPRERSDVGGVGGGGRGGFGAPRR